MLCLLTWQGLSLGVQCLLTHQYFHRQSVRSYSLIVFHVLHVCTSVRVTENIHPHAIMYARGGERTT